MDTWISGTTLESFITGTHLVRDYVESFPGQRCVSWFFSFSFSNFVWGRVTVQICEYYSCSLHLVYD